MTKSKCSHLHCCLCTLYFCSIPDMPFFWFKYTKENPKNTKEVGWFLIGTLHWPKQKLTCWAQNMIFSCESSSKSDPVTKCICLSVHTPYIFLLRYPTFKWCTVQKVCFKEVSNILRLIQQEGDGMCQFENLSGFRTYWVEWSGWVRSHSTLTWIQN